MLSILKKSKPIKKLHKTLCNSQKIANGIISHSLRSPIVIQQLTPKEYLNEVNYSFVTQSPAPHTTTENEEI